MVVNAISKQFFKICNSSFVTIEKVNIFSPGKRLWENKNLSCCCTPRDMWIIFTKFAVDIYFYFDILLPHILVCNIFISRYHGKLKVWASSVKFKSSIITSTSFLQSFVVIDKIVVKLEQLQCFHSHLG